MLRISDTGLLPLRLFSLVISTNLALLPSSSFAASVALASAPLANATVSTEVLPNLMLILDDSGSMAWDYLPDWADGGTNVQQKANAYNNLYYDPAITYSPPAFFDADGGVNITTYPSFSGISTATGANASVTLPNWQKVKVNAFTSSSTTNLMSSVTSRMAYVIEPGEYCSDHALKTCVAATAPTSAYPYPAPLRWCTTSGNAYAVTPAVGKCQAVRSDVAPLFQNARMPSPRESVLTVSSVTVGKSITNIKVGSAEILSVAVAVIAGDTINTVATKIVDSINACNGIATGQCSVGGFAAVIADSSNNPNKITITAGKASLLAPAVTTTGGITTATTNFALVDTSAGNIPGYVFLRVIVPGATAVYPYPGIYPGAAAAAKAPTRTDCADASFCTGNEELTNFANWTAYYRTRTQALKTAISLAFKSVDARYRIGLTAQSYSGATDGSNFLHIDKYELAHKNTFLKTLFGIGTPSSTPTRDALAKVGQIYAHKYPNAVDPVQYSCQKNYAFIATDGYWNTGSQFNTNWNVTRTAGVGNKDGGSTKRPYYEGPTASSNSLADIAKYYYETDLRQPNGTVDGVSWTSNCTGGATPDLPSGGDVCNNDFGIQRMTTFALALGIAGKLDFTSDYRTAGSGDFYNLKNGLNGVNWPDPQVSSGSSQLPERIDDLWHAAVNSDGIYFSAKSPTEVVKSLQDALGQIDKKVGSGAAAATSTLNPTNTDNFSFVASYTTVQWTGNLEARTININTGATALDATWCVENVVADTCSSPSTVVPLTTGASSTYVCRSPGGVDVEIASSCTGTLQSKVAAASDTRTIYMSSGSALQTFSYSNLVARGLNTNFDNAFLRNNLSQRSTLSTDQLSALSGDKLVAYLRGQYKYDMRPGNSVNDQLFRLRAATLGDIVESQPAYIAKPTFYYVDAGYDSFKTGQAGRAGTVYVGTNDGMLHAFDGTNGNERWAFVPTPVIPNLWRLADDMYSTGHRNYVNGSPTISDIHDGSGWKTILVGGLNGGGRGYYALDITDPQTPTLLWEFTSANDSDLGFTFGNPVITKRNDGTWVVLVTSGYNNGSGSGTYTSSPVTEIANSPSGSGIGYLFVLNANTGAKLAKISTATGAAGTPSGLAKISSWADSPTKNNMATYTYGGDLLGNLWRFDINAGSVMKFATLSSGASAQPITTRPELGKVNGKRVVFVGTGKYLEQSDLETTAQQTVYAILDDDATTTLSDPRGAMVQQIMSSSGTTRVTTSNKVDFSTKRGWFVDFADTGERQNVDGLLESGTLLMPTTVPKSTVCSPGGSSWLNFFDYKTGGPVVGSDITSTKFDSPIVGINVVYVVKDPNSPGLKKPMISIVTANNPTPKLVSGVPFGSSGLGFSQKKVIWRELIQ